MIKFTESEDNRELKMSFSNSSDYQHYKELILSEIRKGYVHPKNIGCNCKGKAEKEDSDNKQVKMPDISNLTALDRTHDNNNVMMLAALLSMVFASSGNHDSYYKGMCDAYEKIFAPEKQGEKMNEAREAIKNLKKSIGELNNKAD